MAPSEPREGRSSAARGVRQNATSRAPEQVCCVLFPSLPFLPAMELLLPQSHDNSPSPHLSHSFLHTVHHHTPNSPLHSVHTPLSHLSLPSSRSHNIVSPSSTDTAVVQFSIAIAIASISILSSRSIGSPDPGDHCSHPYFYSVLPISIPIPSPDGLSISL